MKARLKSALNILAKHCLRILLAVRYGGNSRAQRRVRRGPAAGVNLQLDVRSQGACWLGHYDAWILSRVPIMRFLAPGQTARDCGAFVGYYTAIFRDRVGAAVTVVAFEAS
ncbi:MAG: hypothetical protein H7343_19325 [Undibacterium sp.]|nr:hypothetical protein [Opitutaceae bacterium]